MSNSSSSSYPFKYEGRGTMIYVDGYGQMEVTPGSEAYVQSVLRQYANVNGGVKIQRAPNYVGRYESASSSKSSSSSGGAAKRVCK